MVLNKYVRILGLTAAAILGSLLYFRYDPVKFTGYFPKCPFYVLTGYYCPGCGSQRAMAALLHGHLLRAADFNLLFVLFLPLIGYSAAVYVWNSFSRSHVPQSIFYSARFALFLFVLVLAFWILRNLPFIPFQWLAP